MKKESKHSFLKKSITEAFKNNTAKTEIVFQNETLPIHTTIRINSIDEMTQLFVRNKTSVKMILSGLDQSELYNIFERLRDWFFVYETVSEQFVPVEFKEEMSRYTRTNEPIVNFLKDRSTLDRYGENIQETLVVLFIKNTFLLFLEIFRNSNNELVRNLVEKLDLYEQTSNELSSFESTIPAVFRRLSESLSAIQKNIILREITSIIQKLKHIENEALLRSKNEHLMRTVNVLKEKESNTTQEIQRLTSNQAEVAKLRHDYDTQVSENARLLEFLKQEHPVIGKKRIRTISQDLEPV